MRTLLRSVANPARRLATLRRSVRRSRHLAARRFQRRALPGGFQRLRAVDAVLPLERLRRAVALTVAQEDGEVPLAAGRADQVIRQRHALAVEAGDLLGGEILQVHELPEGEPLAVAGTTGKRAGVAAHFLGRAGEDGHAFFGPARRRLVREQV